MLVLKITSCSDSLMWYSNLVGSYVPIVRTLASESCWLSREPAGYSNIVKFADATEETVETVSFY